MNPSDSNPLYSQPCYQKLLAGEVYRRMQENPGFCLFLLMLRAVSGVTLGVLSLRMLQSMIVVLQGQMLNLGDLLEVFTVGSASVVCGWIIYEPIECRNSRSSMLLLMLVPTSFLLSLIPFQMRFRYVWPRSWSYIILAAFGVETIRLKKRNRRD